MDKYQYYSQTNDWLIWRQSEEEKNSAGNNSRFNING